MLTSKQRRRLKGLAHSHKPIVLVGQKGVTEAIVEETRRALYDHELIKVRLRGSEDPEEDAALLAREAEAEFVALTGLIAILYKENPDKPVIKL